MKTRIISGVVMALIVIAVLVAGQYYAPIITAFLALLCAVATFEICHNAAGIKDKLAIAGSCLYAALAVAALDGYLVKIHYLTVVYFLFVVVMCLKNHKDFSLAAIVSLAGMPFLLAYAFASLCAVINHPDGLYYLLLVLNFSSVCDIGAYFVGSALGKHKLCPGISPKKTWEGAVGGIVSALIITLVIVFSFHSTTQVWLTLLLTVPFCIIGMCGDLFASTIKRSVGLKDYGNLIPGHGGILDRFDSILLIAPVLDMCITNGVI